jgi:hypothetical protein
MRLNTKRYMLKVLPQLIVLILLTIAITLSGCSQDGKKAVVTYSPVHVAKTGVAHRVHDFGFVHKESTGITSHVRLDGKDVPIQFGSDSSAASLASLRSLQPEVFLPNANGTTIHLVGQYYEGICHTPSAPDKPQSESYHEFRLDSWYILTPFLEVEEARLDGSGYYTKKRYSLNSGDFMLLEPTSADLKRLQRKR